MGERLLCDRLVLAACGGRTMFAHTTGPLCLVSITHSLAWATPALRWWRRESTRSVQCAGLLRPVAWPGVLVQYFVPSPEPVAAQAGQPHQASCSCEQQVPHRNRRLTATADWLLAAR